MLVDMLFLTDEPVVGGIGVGVGGGLSDFGGQAAAEEGSTIEKTFGGLGGIEPEPQPDGAALGADWQARHELAPGAQV